MNKSVLLTGGSGLIGSALSAHLKDKGYHVIIVDTKAPANLLPGMDYICFDLSDTTKMKSITDFLKQNNIRLTGLINNAAYNPKIEHNADGFRRFEDLAPEDWEAEMKINLTVPVFLTQSLLDLFDLSEGKQGKIINVLSTYGLVPPNPNVYAALSRKMGKELHKPVTYPVAKAGLEMFTRYLAVYLAKRNINVNAIAPGGIENGQDTAFISSYEAHTPMNRMAKTSDLMGAFEFLLSQDSNYMTGQTLVIDGGWTLW